MKVQILPELLSEVGQLVVRSAVNRDVVGSTPTFAVSLSVGQSGQPARFGTEASVVRIHPLRFVCQCSKVAMGIPNPRVQGSIPWVYVVIVA